MLERRVTYKRQASYRTKSNKFRTQRTPGGKLAIKYLTKNTRGTRMQGVKVARPHALKKMSYCNRTVSRAYGGLLTHSQVRERITRAFMIEEIKNVQGRMAAGDSDKKKKKAKKGTKKPTKK